jgi:hypothetical protein
VEVSEEYRIKISSRFEVLEIFGGSGDINKAWENITGNIKVSAKESLGQSEWKQLQAWFDEECPKFVDQGVKLNCNDLCIQESVI